VDFVETTDDVASGLSEAVLIGPGDGAIHLEVALARLEPGGIVNGHIHPFEESFYLLEGEVVFTVADQSYQIMPGGFGFAPIATAHTWFAASDAPAVWIRTRSPQPRTLGKTNGTYPVAHRLAKRSGQPIAASDRSRRFVGHFDDAAMPKPGSLQIKGFRSSAPTNVAVWMLVDEIIGALHHTKFSVRFDPTDSSMTLDGQHFHPFEETYYITAGRAIAHLEDESHEVGVGDLIFAGVNALHGFTNPGAEPVRWIEMQAPSPPTSASLFLADDWSTR